MCVFTVCMCSTGLCVLKLKVSLLWVFSESSSQSPNVSTQTGRLKCQIWVPPPPSNVLTGRPPRGGLALRMNPSPYEAASEEPGRD